jgi:hypothetical protein
MDMMTALANIGACIDLNVELLGTPMHIAVEKGISSHTLIFLFVSFSQIHH